LGVIAGLVFAIVFPEAAQLEELLMSVPLIEPRTQLHLT
jgi:hypothetical protein